ncbi:hypothetical protein TrVE_jg6607 [Triparma verrucosa]|uniref:Uncharacterized protein n=1 Tax=Triparma verrucosa TaxID=1606542 RepID=A0A9W7BPR4_9STRA|nr:hypothetical protein TrVE_jg6607 [Triparma verrucosa]
MITGPLASLLFLKKLKVSSKLSFKTKKKLEKRGKVDCRSGSKSHHDTKSKRNTAASKIFSRTGFNMLFAKEYDSVRPSQKTKEPSAILRTLSAKQKVSR